VAADLFTSAQSMMISEKMWSLIPVEDRYEVVYRDLPCPCP